MESRKLTEVSVGDRLPELTVPITTTVIVAGALATQDFTPVHHDKAAAQAQGLSDIIMNTMTTNGFVSRYVTDWSGPDARLVKIALKLGAPNSPGDTMKLNGSVTAIDVATGIVDIDVSGTNSWGDHVTASVRVALPEGA